MSEKFNTDSIIHRLKQEKQYLIEQNIKLDNELKKVKEELKFQKEERENLECELMSQ